MKKAICIGINNYPGFSNDLQGCVNDAEDWAALLQGYGFEVSIMLDAQATSDNIKAALDVLVAEAGEGDVLVLTYSGHGTQYRDTSGDENDSYDEALYVYDGRILDDELRTIINGIDPKATLVVVTDSCFSGSVTRLVPENARPRYFPLEDMSSGQVVRKRFLLPEANLPEVLITGCTDSEYSYDAEINGRYNGAMSAMAISVIKQKPDMSYNEFHSELRKFLPSSDYPQSPQLEGSEAHRNTILFQPFAVAAEPGPPPTPEPNPVPTESPGCLAGAMQAIARFFGG